MKNALLVLLAIIAQPVIGCTPSHDWHGSVAPTTAGLDSPLTPPEPEPRPVQSDAGRDREAPEYEVIDLGTLGGAASMAYDVNDAGQVVGCAEIGAGVFHAFIWQDGVMSDLGVLPGDTQSCADGVNNVGQVVGSSYPVSIRRRAVLWQRGDAIELASSTAGARARGINDFGHVVGQRQVSEQKSSYVDTHPQAFLWRDGETVDLGGQFEDPSSVACAINNLGQVVGYSECDCRATPGPRAFLWDPGEIVYLGTFGGGDARALAINDSGAVVGEAEMMITRRGAPLLTSQAFLWEHGRLVNLGTLGGDTSSAADINAPGRIVGWSTTAEGSSHAFVWDGSAMRDLNDSIPPDSGWILSKAHGINNAGEIVGEGEYDGQTRAFLLTHGE